MNCEEFIEKITGIKLLHYQKELLKTMEAHKDDVIAMSPITGKLYFFPKKKEEKLV